MLSQRSGYDIDSAKVGDPLALRFEIVERDTPYGIFVRDLIAMDGQDSSEILLIDGSGRNNFDIAEKETPSICPIMPNSCSTLFWVRSSYLSKLKLLSPLGS